MSKKEKGLRHGKWLLLREGGRRGLIRNRKNSIKIVRKHKGVFVTLYLDFL